MAERKGARRYKGGAKGKQRKEGERFKDELIGKITGKKIHASVIKEPVIMRSR